MLTPTHLPTNQDVWRKVLMKNWDWMGGYLASL
jgi:hypothetical protein